MENKTKVCRLCKDTFNDKGYYCQSCYAYLREHPEGLYPKPPKGTILYATNGDPICHICCKAYRKLGNHIRFKHHITQEEYRETYGLYHNSRLSNKEYRDVMRKYNKDNYNVVVEKNLLEGGKGTRVSSSNILPGRKIGNNKIKEEIFLYR